MYMLRSELWEDCRERWDRIQDYLDGDPRIVDWCDTIPEAAKDWATTENTADDGAVA
jgi:hypothetical protein